MKSQMLPIAAAVAGAVCAAPAAAADVYLNRAAGVTVAVGPSTSAGSFNNTFSGGQTIDKVIDAPTAASSEIHSQTTHIWWTADAVGGALELLFDFQIEYDISTLHFWNYDEEGYDVDNISFSFFNAANVLQGTLAVTPALGSSPAIFAQDLALAAPLNVRYVTALLSGTNRQVDFQNIGFTAQVSAPPTGAVPEPGTWLMMIAGFGMIGAVVRRRERETRLRFA